LTIAERAAKWGICALTALSFLLSLSPALIRGRFMPLGAPISPVSPSPNTDNDGFPHLPGRERCKEKTRPGSLSLIDSRPALAQARAGVDEGISSSLASPAIPRRSRPASSGPTSARSPPPHSRLESSTRRGSRARGRGRSLSFRRKSYRQLHIGVIISTFTSCVCARVCACACARVCACACACVRVCVRACVRVKSAERKERRKILTRLTPVFFRFSEIEPFIPSPG